MTEKKIHRTNNYYLKQIANNTGSHINTHRTNNYLLKQIAENTKGGGGDTPTWESTVVYDSEVTDLGVTVGSDHFKVEFDLHRHSGTDLTGIVIGDLEGQYVGVYDMSLIGSGLGFIVQDSTDMAYIWTATPVFTDGVCHIEFEYNNGKLTSNYFSRVYDAGVPFSPSLFNYIVASANQTVENIKLWVY